MVSGQSIRNFFVGIGSVIVLTLLLPTLTPFFSNQGNILGGVPGALSLIALPVIFLSVLYGIYRTSRRSTGRMR